ncbi:MAG: acyltransferase domain-containing protein, partial [Actinomycetota bacterium]|nr:acyltransferase domain-containing protein [Actinomycetota bacterium]
MSETPTALLFPGQGSQTPDMRAEAERHRPELLEQVIEAVGEDPFEHVDAGTRYLQPALYCAALASWSRLGEPSADFLAGHSLGELAALVAAGSLDPADGARLVALRGRLMDEAGERAEHPGGMLAVIGSGELSPDELAQRHGLSVANDNAPGQLV